MSVKRTVPVSMHAKKVESHPFSQLSRATIGIAGFGISKTNGVMQVSLSLVSPGSCKSITECCYDVYFHHLCRRGCCYDDQWCRQRGQSWQIMTLSFP